MDGTRDRPPGRTAENWSRKDHIRAGAVTGPWRSAPRPAQAVALDLSPPEPVVPAVTPVPRVAPKPPPAVTSHEAIVPSPPAEPEFRQQVRRRTVSMTVWIGAGLIFATATVAAAFLFRPDPAMVPDEQPPVAEVLPETPEPAAAPAGPLAALAAVGQVRLRIGPDFPAERRDTILATLAAAGVSAVQVEPLPFAVATSRVGYYRPEDLAAAEALSGLIGPVAGDAEIGVRDYGALLADAEPGRLDLWVGGE